MVVKGLTCFLARFKEETITLDSVMKMSGGKVGLVMVLLEKKGKKKDFLSYHRESQERSTYIREVRRACEWTGREKYRHQRRRGFLGEDKSLHYPQSIAYGTHRKVTGLS